MSIQITNEDNLILQSYYMVLLFETLADSKFASSSYFDALNFRWPFAKEGLKEIGIVNQGSKLMTLYAMLVLPKELIETQFPAEYKNINEYLSQVCKNVKTNYQSDKSGIAYVKHLRNSLAHARIKFNPKENATMTFSDEYERKGKIESFSADLPQVYFGELLKKLEAIHLRYINERNNSN